MCSGEDWRIGNCTVVVLDKILSCETRFLVHQLRCLGEDLPNPNDVLVASQGGPKKCRMIPDTLHLHLCRQNLCVQIYIYIFIYVDTCIWLNDLICVCLCARVYIYICLAAWYLHIYTGYNMIHDICTIAPGWIWSSTNLDFLEIA